jgi:hypothetical protein
MPKAIVAAGPDPLHSAPEEVPDAKCWHMQELEQMVHLPLLRD